MSNLAAPQRRYRLSLTAQEIEQLIRSIGGKLNADAITQDLSSTQDDEVLSAKVANEVLSKLINRTEGDGVKEMIDNAPGINSLTDELLNKINTLDLVFVGTFTVTQRDALDTSSYSGGETILLLNATTGWGKFQYYDLTTNKWLNANILEDHTNDDTVLNAGSRIIQSLDINTYRTATFVISARTAAEVHVSHMTFAWVGSTVYTMITGEIISGDPLFDVVADTSSTDVNVTVQTLKGNVRVQFQPISIF